MDVELLPNASAGPSEGWSRRGGDRIESITARLQSPARTWCRFSIPWLPPVGPDFAPMAQGFVFPALVTAAHSPAQARRGGRRGGAPAVGAALALEGRKRDPLRLIAFAMP